MASQKRKRPGGRRTSDSCPHLVLQYWGSGRSSHRGDGVICDACGLKWRRVGSYTGRSALKVTRLEAVVDEPDEPDPAPAN